MHNFLKCRLQINNTIQISKSNQIRNLNNNNNHNSFNLKNLKLNLKHSN